MVEKENPYRVAPCPAQAKAGFAGRILVDSAASVKERAIRADEARHRVGGGE
jgi:hypothetical protein